MHSEEEIVKTTHGRSPGGAYALTRHTRRDEVLRRLSRIEGHVGGIRRMVQNDTDCPAVLIQIGAVRSALEKAGKILLEDHMEHCIAEATRTGKGDEALTALKEAIARIM